MTESEKLATLKVLLNIADETTDDMLTVYLSVAASKVLLRAYPYDKTQTDVPEQYALAQCQIAAYLYNKQGAEGESYHSENGINRSYENADVPKSLLSSIVPCAGVIG